MQPRDALDESGSSPPQGPWMTAKEAPARTLCGKSRADQNDGSGVCWVQVVVL